jgi:CheY-like chemotaxis protein
MTLDILLVDDSEGFAALLREASRLAGLDDRWHHVTDGKRALTYLRGNGSPANAHPPRWPDLVLVDLYMPIMDGFELIKAVRADDRLKRMPVHAWSGDIKQGDIERAYALGANSFMIKPGTLETIQQTLLRLHRLHDLMAPPTKEG